MELHEFGIGQDRARLRGQHQSLPDRAGRVGVCSNKPPTPPVASTARRVGSNTGLAGGRRGEHGRDAPVLQHQAPRLYPLEHGDTRGFGARPGPRTHDLASGSVAPGMHDTPPRMRRFEAEQERAVPVAGRTARRSVRALDRIRPVPQDTLDDGFGIAQPVTGRDRVGDMRRHAFIGADGRGDAALRPDAGTVLPEWRRGSAARMARARDAGPSSAQRCPRR